MIVLKIVSIILLVMLVLLLLVLAVPFCYSIKGTISEKAKGVVIISWLFYLVGIRCYFGENNGFVMVRVLFINFKLKNKIGIKTSPDKKVIKKKKKKHTKDNKEKRNVLELIQSVIDYPDKNEIAAALKQLLKRLFRAVSPDKFRIYGVLGFEDPFDTGVFFGALGALLGLVNLDIDLKGNFECAQKDLNGIIKGKLIIISLMIPFIAAVLKRPVRKLIGNLLFRKEESV